MGKIVKAERRWKEANKEKGREKRMRKLGGTEKVMTRERRQLNQRMARKEWEVGDFDWTSVSVSPSVTHSLRQFGFFNLTDRGGGFSACPDPQWGQCAL